MLRADTPVRCGRPSFMSFFLITIRSAVLFNMRLPLCPCCCSSATSKGFFLFPLQFFRFFRLSAKFSVYSGRKQKNTRVPTLGYSGATHNTALPGGRRVRGFVGIEPLVPPPARKKCIFSRKKFVQPVRSVLVRTCTAN